MTGPEHYFSTEPSARHRERTVRLDVGDVTADLRTDRGVFSARRIDPGTRLLLRHAPLPAAAAGVGIPGGGGRAPVGAGVGAVLADLGCGYGPIAVALARRAPEATVWAVDVNRRARELTAANLTAAGVTVSGGGSARGRARVCAPEEVPDTQRFDAVYCNPPVRIGNTALDELLAGWLRRLHPGGFAVIVMHRHLGADSLRRRLEAAGRQVARLATGGGYRVLEVRPGPDGVAT